MIDAHRVQDGGVKIVDMHRIFDDVIAEVIGFAVTVSWLESTACKKNAETARVVIPTVISDAPL